MFGIKKFLNSNTKTLNNFFHSLNGHKIINVTKLPKSNKFVDKLLKMPGKTKAIALIALPALLAVDYIRSKHLYKMGQIDQKYTDQAKLKENTKLA